MFCSYCGKSILDDSRFCCHCGKAVVHTEAQPAGKSTRYSSYPAFSPQAVYELYPVPANPKKDLTYIGGVIPYPRCQYQFYEHFFRKIANAAADSFEEKFRETIRDFTSFLCEFPNLCMSYFTPYIQMLSDMAVKYDVSTLPARLLSEKIYGKCKSKLRDLYCDFGDRLYTFTSSETIMWRKMGRAKLMPDVTPPLLTGVFRDGDEPCAGRLYPALNNILWVTPEEREMVVTSSLLANVRSMLYADLVNFFELACKLIENEGVDVGMSGYEHRHKKWDPLKSTPRNIIRPVADNSADENAEEIDDEDDYIKAEPDDYEDDSEEELRRQYEKELDYYYEGGAALYMMGLLFPNDDDE